MISSIIISTTALAVSIAAVIHVRKTHDFYETIYQFYRDEERKKNAIIERLTASPVCKPSKTDAEQMRERAAQILVGQISLLEKMNDQTADMDEIRQNDEMIMRMLNMVAEISKLSGQIKSMESRFIPRI